MSSIVMRAPNFAKNRKTAAVLLAGVVAMVMLSYAAVPLYRMFCEATGFGGATKRGENVSVDSAATAAATRIMRLDFDTNVAQGLPWSFKALQSGVSFKVGEPQLIFFEVTNHSDQPISGNSTFNVTPHEIGPYFVKTECFCYEERTLAPGVTVKLPVSFYIDPSIEEDKTLKNRHAVTLSYTFFKTPTATSTQP